MTTAAVDMSLTRAKRTMRNCLEQKGFDAANFATGVFAAYWEAFEASGGFRETVAGEDRRRGEER
jgi:hypothetical protein